MAKKKGGVGRHVTKNVPRTFNPNLREQRIWVTEYGYQTNPPDRIFGVSPALQARYLTQAYGIMKRNPRIDMMLWFLLRDEKRALLQEGWQSGFLTETGVRKPSFAAFQKLR